MKREQKKGKEKESTWAIVSLSLRDRPYIVVSDDNLAVIEVLYAVRIIVF